MGVFQSGAFLQQCFAVHPLSLSLKLVSLPKTVGVVCTNCRMRHRLTLRHLTLQPSDKSGAEGSELLFLHKCSETHPEDVRVSMVDVVQDSVEFRCRPCRRTYVVDIELFETHQS